MILIHFSRVKKNQEDSLSKADHLLNAVLKRVLESRDGFPYEWVIGFPYETVDKETF